MSNQLPFVLRYRGELSDVEILPEGGTGLPQGPDLLQMAERALGYLVRNPDPQHNYDARFTFFPHLCPPFAPSVTANLFVQRVVQRYMEDSESEFGRFVDGESYTFHWTGSTVTRAEPRGAWLPLYP